MPHPFPTRRSSYLTDFHSSQLSGQSRRFVVMTRLDDLARAVEATLFASDKPLSIMEIRHYAGGEGDVATAPEKLADHYAERGVHLVERGRSEEHTSELQSLMRIAYAVFCLK